MPLKQSREKRLDDDRMTVPPRIHPARSKIANIYIDIWGNLTLISEQQCINI